MPKLYDNKVDVAKKPGWLKIRLHRTTQFAEVDRIVREHALHTICSSGMCPNKAECWSRRTATFMILGDVCTRSCRFCATRTGRPLPPDDAEPGQLARSVKLMGLRHVVVTSVTRDDLPDGGARHWAAAVEAIRRENHDATIELLIPDFDARPELLDTVRSPILSGTTSKPSSDSPRRCVRAPVTRPRSARWSCSHDAAPRPKAA